MTSFAWLDFSEHDRRRALEVIDLFREKETVDELGIGTVRDAFSELLHPGTSVIHTRARYFLFIPWIYLRLERKKVSSDRIAGEARKAELQLIPSLLASDDTSGTIGKLAGQKLKILPSAVYWQALNRLSIRHFAGTRDQYHRSLDRFYAARGRQTGSEEGDLASRFRRHNWHIGIPDPPPDFPASASMTLRHVEADFLRERIVFSAPNSLYRHLVEENEPPADADFPWQYDRIAELPPVLQEQLLHARNFSEAIHGAPLLYNLLLAEKSAREGKPEEYIDRLAEWRLEYGQREDEFARWDRRRFWDIVIATGARITPSTRTFIDAWLTLAHRLSADQLRTSGEARRLILERERQLKRGLARLENDRALELWNGDAGTGRVNYRWGIVKQMLGDILGAHDAGANDA